MSYTKEAFEGLMNENIDLKLVNKDLVEALETAKRALDRLAEIDQIYLNDTYAQIVKALTKAKGGKL